MNLDIKNKLDAIVGKSFNYNGENIKIEKYKEVNLSNTVIFTDRRSINFLNSEIPEFLENLYQPLEKKVEENQVLLPKHELSVFEPTKENGIVKATLLETLQKVKEDPSYIPQAEAVCAVVSQIVNVQKTEIQMLKILKAKRN